MAAFDWTQHEKILPAEPESRTHWVVRLTLWLARTLRPRLGWIVFAAIAALVLCALLGLEATRWVNVRQARFPLTWLVVAAPTSAWLIRALGSRSILSRLTAFFLHLILAPLIIAQILVGWLPTFSELWTTFRAVDPAPNWQDLGWQMGAALERLGLRMVLWVDGVRTGGATQDDLVFLALALLVIWIATALTVELLHATQRGLISALPLLWLIGAMVYYSNDHRLYLVAAIALALALHLRLDQQSLFADWTRRDVAFSPDLALDRMVAAAPLIMVVLILAALTPNLFIRPLARSVYDAMRPWNDRLTSVGDRLFPDMQRDLYNRFASGGLGGLPNSFLLGGGPDLGDRVVMRIRTNESHMQDTGISGPPIPLGHYVRGATLAVYDGQGWQNPDLLARAELSANQPWAEIDQSLRRPLLQSILLTDAAPVIYAAPEPVEVSAEVAAETVNNSLIALRPADPGSARSYTVLSALPAVDAATLSALPPLSPDDALAPFLALPDTITPRTRQLAGDLSAGSSSAYATAAAIEAYLRTLPYDLDVDKPPSDVTDVADYFLFDLQRGYCDYYATAFIVLARLNGLPARFATGYAMGSWDDVEREWTVTEAQAHSWPEVYFPQAGWVAFEPTAGRPPLVRWAAATAPSLPSPQATPQFDPFQPTGIQWRTLWGIAWNWQMLFWLLPIGLLLAGLVSLIWRWRLSREDAWLGLLAWGTRLGRPAAEGETELEYAHGLAAHLSARGSAHRPEQTRTVNREILALSQEASQIHYGPAEQRPPAQIAAHRRWRILRSYLVRMWMRR